MRPILEVSHVSKKYRIGHSPGSYHSLRDRIANFFRSDEVTEDFWALKDVSFRVDPFEDSIQDRDTHRGKDHQQGTDGESTRGGNWISRGTIGS